MSGRPIDVAPDGTVAVFHYDHATGAITIEHRHANIKPLLDHLASERNAKGRGAWKKDVVKVASLTPVMIVHLMNRGIMSRGFRIVDPEAFQRWLNEYNVFKATEGRFV